ncbi:MAG: alpha/beta hydrolase [Alphaproteobacteria bacterium]|nr:alpha/beta hydrolase [Candidatus Jidaibacter sp.]
MRKNLLRFLVVLALIYVAVSATIYFKQRSLLYFPDKDIKEISSYSLGDTQDLMIKSKDGTEIQIWYKKAEPNKPMALYFHGNSYNLGKRSEKFRELIDLGYGFVAPSYHGFGKSDGNPSKEAILGDARTAIKFLEDQGYKTEDTVVIGESLGSGVAVQMATEYKFREVFLITPYTSIADRAQQIYWYLPVQYLVKDNFINSDKIAKINAPLLMVHGTKDDVIPHSHAEALFAIAEEPKKLIIYDGKGHSNLDNREIFTEMTKFLSNGSKVENGEQK